MKPILPPAAAEAAAFPGCAILPIAYADPETICAAHAERPGTVWLDSAASDHPSARRSLLAFAPRSTSFFTRDSTDNPFQSLKQSIDPAVRPAAIVALLGYESGRHVDRMPPPKKEVPKKGGPKNYKTKSGDQTLPEAWIGLYDAVAVFDHSTETAFVAASGWPETEPSAQARAALDRARAFASALIRAPIQTAARAFAWKPERSAEDFAAAIAQTIAFIHAGDIYQTNLSLRFSAKAPETKEIFPLYARLRRAAPAPFGAYLRLACDTALLSASPERFLQVSAEGLVRAQPIKGTRPRAADPAQDQRLRLSLRENTKERAENLMIVDLLRNDIARVCRPGTVSVPSLFAVESFATLHHLVSTVEGRLLQGKDAVDLLAACFPGGSITGAPKIRAIEIIRELEHGPRGFYCGALALFTPDGAMDSAILIRTITIGDGQAVAQAGSGIVADSEPQAEIRETWLKARALLRSLDPESESPLWDR